MEYFYREQRKRLGVLMQDDGKTPVGERWNLDEDNRESFKKAPGPPKPYTPRSDAITEEVLDLVSRRFADNPGISKASAGASLASRRGERSTTSSRTA
jgi:deoxyribodipyrimidine photolyase-related protein